MLTLLGLALGGVKDYFVSRQEIKKIKVQAEKDVIVAETNATIKRLDKEADQDYDLNRESIRAMNGSWKDEFVLILLVVPFVMLFIPSLQPYAIAGFDKLGVTPFWYQVLVVSIFFSIYGLRDILKLVLQFMMNRKGK